MTRTAGNSLARSAAEQAARESYGRLLAWLVRQWRDVAAAEDALAEAFAVALKSWPTNGVPDSPEAWLLTAARRNLLQAHRHGRVAGDPATVMMLVDAAVAADRHSEFPDERLKLLFVCAHPSIDPPMRTALMLQTVLGIDAARIASAFLVSPAAMAQRLVRAKARIKEARIPFVEPEREELGARIHAVLEAVYAAYGVAWDTSDGGSDAAELSSEAVYLARLLVDLLPDDPEAAGLLALFLFCEARRSARHTSAGEFVPLPMQDAGLWDRPLLAAADHLLWSAAKAGLPGPFQVEAAIQSAHCQRAFGQPAPRVAIASLYDRLVEIAPTAGALVGQAVAHGECGLPLHALQLLGRIDESQVAAYQPYWVAKGYMHAKAMEPGIARQCYVKAIGLTTAPAVRAYLLKQLQDLEPDRAGVASG